MKNYSLLISKSAAILLLTLICVNLSAQKRINLSELDSEQLNTYLQKATKLRNTGRTLTIAGGAVYVTSFIVLVNYSENTKVDPKTLDSGTVSFFLPVCILSFGATVAGIPAWIAGGARKSRAEVALKTLNIKPENTAAIELGITIRF